MLIKEPSKDVKYVKQKVSGGGLQNLPDRERIIWENASLRESLALGLEESANGNVHYLGSFE